MRGVTACAVAVMVGIAIAGCGGDDEDESFNDDYKPVNAELLDYGRELARAVRGAGDKTDAQVADQFEELAGDLRGINGRLRNLDPPDDLKDELDGLTADLDAGSGVLAEISSAAKRHDNADARAAVRELVSVSQRINQNQNKLAEATGADRGET